jgi:hypothetical protein
MKDAIIAGIISGLISPLVLSWLQHRLIWKSQKRYEIKLKTFTDAVSALSSLETDSLDPQLQANKQVYKGIQRMVELRPETIELLERARGMVKAFFSAEAYQKLDQALKTKISIENVPNIEFEENRTAAIVSLANELGIDSHSFWGGIKGRCR